jgi:hypothetical protein
MATGKVARRTAVGDVGELLDSPEVAALIDEIDASGDPRGQKGFGTRALVGACLVKTLFALPTWTRVAGLIAEHPGLQAVLGDSPSLWACYRFTVKLRANQPLLSACLDRVAESLQAEFPGIGEDVAIDASDMPGRAVSPGGVRVREARLRQRAEVRQSEWPGARAVSTRRGGGFYGYKLHLAVCTHTGLPLAWRVETGRRNESLYVVLSSTRSILAATALPPARWTRATTMIGCTASANTSEFAQSSRSKLTPRRSSLFCKSPLTEAACRRSFRVGLGASVSFTFAASLLSGSLDV